MKIIDVLNILEGGGYICEICPIQGKRIYKVFKRRDPQAARFCGNCSEKQFISLQMKGVLYPYNTFTDKYNKIHNFYELQSAPAET